jgi:hypothetical protein
MEPVRRIRLATILASSLLQLNRTLWLTTYLDKQAIHFFRDMHAVSTIDSDHPFIVKAFPDKSIPENTEDTAGYLGNAMVELGIILLEIWHRQTFESWVLSDLHANVNTEDPDVRELYSWKWFKQIKDDLVPAYRDVIDVCFRPPLDFATQDWEVDDFQKVYCAKVIFPLITSQL